MIGVHRRRVCGFQWWPSWYHSTGRVHVTYLIWGLWIFVHMKFDDE